MLQSLLAYFSSDLDTHRLGSDSAWLLFVTWLANRLLYYSLKDDDDFAAAAIQTASASLMASVCQDRENDVISSLFATGDAEMALLILTERFEAFNVSAVFVS